jgi:hypothetical protein
MTITLKIGGATTGRKFTDPIRYFKANDPYYWEVDNIPLKQLQENVKYVNDRLNTAIVSGNLDTSRNDISELKPYVNGSDDQVRVLPGRYTARINNAHDIDHLDAFTRLKSSDIIGRYTNYAWDSSTTLDGLIARIKSSVGEDALNLNGLSERVFAMVAKSPDEPPDYDDERRDYPTFIWPLPSAEPMRRQWWYYGNAMPLIEHLGWYKYLGGGPGKVSWGFKSGVTGGSLFLNKSQANEDPNSLMNLGILENALIKYWRGTARTAIVDIPEELSIEIRPFLKNTRGLETATSRIDLVFIYSKPIDTSAVTIGKFIGGTKPRSKITEPILGVMEGAGIMYQTTRYGRTPFLQHGGINRMQASIADQNNTDNGFKVGVNQKVAIHGSFPSPEDLLNIAPLLSEQLEEESWLLTGQTIMPVAYIKVNKTPGVNVLGSQVLTEEDLVDIRPLFRTAELTYNERAGIAGANPPLSLANRAVGRYELEYEINNLHEDHDARLKRLEAGGMTYTTEHTYFLGGSTSWYQFVHTYSNKGVGGPRDGFALLGTKAIPAVFNMRKYIHHDINTIEPIALILNIRGGHISGGRDVRPQFGVPRIYMGAESTLFSDGKNYAVATGRTSRWGEKQIMRFGLSVNGTNASEQYLGVNNTFMQPVQLDRKTNTMDIFTWSDRRCQDDYADYYVITVIGYVYKQHHSIKLF